jgi:CheY-like chemotaxis protein
MNSFAKKNQTVHSADRRFSSRKKMRKVLAVDDEEVMGYVIQRIVRHLGYHVDWVTSCETALERIQKENYDVILSDFRMPNMSGEQFYQEIADRDLGLLKRLIFVTGDTVSVATLQFLRKTDVPFLSKPFKIDDLEKVLHKVIGRR